MVKPTINVDFLNTLHLEQSLALEILFTREEIKHAI